MKISISKEHIDWLRGRVDRYLICVHFMSNNLASNRVSAKDREIVEWAAAVVDLHLNARLIDEYSAFVRPDLQQKLPSAFLNKAGIWQEIIDKAPSYKEVNEEFGALLSMYGKDCAWCSWGSDDRSQIERDSARHKVKPALNPARHIDLKSWYEKALTGSGSCGLERVILGHGLEWRGAESRSISEVRNMASLLPHALGVKRNNSMLVV